MASIKTNFNTEKHFVLTNNENKIMAIINCPAGKNDISEKLKQAIIEYEMFEEVTFKNDVLMEESGPIFILKTIIIDFQDDNHTDTRYYNLTESWIY